MDDGDRCLHCGNLPAEEEEGEDEVTDEDEDEDECTEQIRVGEFNGTTEQLRGSLHIRKAPGLHLLTGDSSAGLAVSGHMHHRKVKLGGEESTQESMPSSPIRASSIVPDEDDTVNTSGTITPVSTTVRT